MDGMKQFLIVLLGSNRAITVDRTGNARIVFLEEGDWRCNCETRGPCKHLAIVHDAQTIRLHLDRRTGEVV